MSSSESHVRIIEFSLKDSSDGRICGNVFHSGGHIWTNVFLSAATYGAKSPILGASCVVMCLTLKATSGESVSCRGGRL